MPWGSARFGCYTASAETSFKVTVAAIRPVAIKINEDTRARVKRLADARQRTPDWLIREAITKYVDREDLSSGKAACRRAEIH